MHATHRFDSGAAVRETALLGITGLAAGMINGLLGAGGGIIVVLVLSAWQQRRGRGSRQGENGGDPRDVYAASLCSMLPVSILSAVQYAKRGAISLEEFSPFLIPALVGGVIGGLALDRVRLPWLQKLFAVLLLVGGARMLLR